MTTVISSVHLIGSAPVGLGQREGCQASRAAELSAARYVRRSTVRHAFNKLDGMCRAGQAVTDIQAVANSYFGIFGQANAWRLRARMGKLLRRHGHIVALQNNRMFTERLPL